MALDRLPFLKVKSLRNGSIVGIPLLNICVPSSEMSREEAEACIMIL